MSLAGEFAEAVRDQFLNERIEYYKDLETAIADAALADGTTISSDMCNQEHVKAGLRKLDPDMPDHTVSTPAACCICCTPALAQQPCPRGQQQH